ncbi:A-kinase anchor protein 1, mitochondrial-like [Tubulanus polymorphus]|uniref:A-kinase anchor protein 1, mitochondrial-like n=1 Tax=Tubulanus polymorphus TaxID=672921 RepID=UPI003DA226CC
MKMSSLRTIVTLFVPTVVAVVGYLIWRRKKTNNGNNESDITQRVQDITISENENNSSNELPVNVSPADVIEELSVENIVKNDLYPKEDLSDPVEVSPVVEEVCEELIITDQTVNAVGSEPTVNITESINNELSCKESCDCISDIDINNDQHNNSWSDEIEKAEETKQTTADETDSHDIEHEIESTSDNEPKKLMRPNSIPLGETGQEVLSPRKEKSSAESISSDGSNDSGKGGSVMDVVNNAEDIQVYQFTFPSDLCAMLVGRRGRTVNGIREESGASIALLRNIYSRDTQICSIEGTESQIQAALVIIKRKFPQRKFPGIDYRQINAAPPASPMLSPELMQLNLPEAVNCDVIVSSIVSAGQLFIQQPTHPTYPTMDRLVQCMYTCYTEDFSVPELPKPIEGGVICAAPIMDGWYRGQVVSYMEESDECDVKFVDYGGYARISCSSLKQIRGDFMTVPFQATECYMANVAPLEGEEDYSEEAGAVLEELTQGQLLQAQIVAHDAETNVPYINLYQVQGNVAFLINRELVLRGVCRWMEHQT